jgi:small subunit ribosomal protein S14
MERAYQRIMNSLASKPAKRDRFEKFNVPKQRAYGYGKRRCIRCGKAGSHIKVHGLDYCRECFREVAKDLGFSKYGAEA